MSDLWARRLIFQAYCFVGGVAAGRIYPLPHGQVPFLYGLFAALLALSLFGYVRSRRANFPVLLATILFGVSCFFLGWGRYSKVHSVENPGHLSKFTTESWSERASVEGVIVTDPEVFSDHVSFVLNPIRVRREGRDLEYSDVSGGRVAVTIWRTAKDYYDEFARSEAYGWRIRVNAPLEAPPAEVNPHGFSYRDYLADQDIYAVQTVSVGWGTPPPVETLDQGEGFFLTEWALGLKEKILSVFVRTIPHPESTFLAGVTIGLRAALETTKCIVPGHDWYVTEECRVAGVTHVLAVSGQHVTILSGMLFVILSAFRIPLRVQAPLIILVLFVFLIITGLPPSAMRATLMNSLTIFFLALSRGTLQSSLMFGIAEAAFVVLFINPKYIVQPSFTLSFAAVLSLGLLSWRIDRLLRRLRGPAFLWTVGSIFLVTILCTHPFWERLAMPAVHYPLLFAIAAGFAWCLTLSARGIWPAAAYERLPAIVRIFVVAQGAILLGMMIPLSSFYFGRFSLAGPFANLVAIPLTGLIVPLGLAAGLVGLVPGVGMFLALILNATCCVLVKIFFYTAHYATVLFPYPFVENLTLSRLGLYYAALALFVWWEPIYQYGASIYIRYYKYAEDPAIRRNVLGIAFVSGALLILAAGHAWERPPAVPPGILRVTFLSTLCGSSAVVTSPDGKTYLIDGALNPRGAQTDVGQRTIAPFLLKQGITEIEAVILTSAGPEHTEGLAGLMDGFRIRRFYDPVPLTDPGQFADLAATDSANAYWMFLEDIGDSYLKQTRYTPHTWRVYAGYAPLIQSAVRRGIPRMPIADGTEIARSDAGDRPFRMIVLHPAGDVHNAGAVVRVEYGSFSILFTGDVAEPTLERLLDADGPGRALLEADVLVVPDHGRRPASRHAAFLRSVRPSYAVIQAGKFKLLYGGSREAKVLVDTAKEEYDLTKEFYEERLGSDRVLDPDPRRDGAIVIESDGKKYRVDTLKRKNKA